MENIEAAKWDSAADNYQQVFSLGISEYNRRVLDFLSSRGHIFQGSRVLDIGCGVGKYGTYLAALGCRMALNDISPKMLDFARENMKAYPETEFFCGDFSAPDFCITSGSFDLVMSTMSPAVGSPAAIEKMKTLSRGGVFIARFAKWSQPTRDRLLNLAGVTVSSSRDSVAASCLEFENMLGSLGIEYEKQLQPYCWSDKRTAAEFAGYVIRNYSIACDDFKHEKLIDAAKALADENGFISDEVNTLTAWYYMKGSAEI